MTTLYFTKTLFKLALSCPTKLYYTATPDIYKNAQEEDAFLEALQAGGFQVGALAKEYITGGVDLEGCNNEQALQQTQELLEQENVTIYEALFRHDNMQIRSDILIKNGNHIEIIEVKSTSYNAKDDCKFTDPEGRISGELRTSKGKVISGWKEYLLDVSFQSYVIDKVLPDRFVVDYFLMVIDKDQECPVNGLNQKFVLVKDPSLGKTKIKTKLLTSEDKQPWLLKKINVGEHINELKHELYEINSIEMSFDLYVKKLAEDYTKRKKIVTELGSKCKSCEFKSSFEEEANGLKSGVRECWKQTLHWQDSDFNDKTVLDIWKFRPKDKMIKLGKLKLEDVCESDINLKEQYDFLTESARQLIQIQKYDQDDKSNYYHPALNDVINNWQFPLHFIDFETCTVAIPFHKGHKPYEPLAFQFSHHIMYEDGTIAHKGEYIETRPNVFPNYDFVRNLKQELETDEGTIFRFHNHENTILNAIHKQLSSENSEVNDKQALMEFIEHITVKKNSRKIIRRGERCMVDLEEVLRIYTYFPSIDGKTSMKVIFPAILRMSKALQEKYSKPIYGAKDCIKSININDWCVVKQGDGGEITDPYSRLPGVYENVPEEDRQLFEKAERIGDIDIIKEGGMASIAYAMMQFTEMAEVEREAIKVSLLKYCELDTLAMVLLYEFLKESVI